MPVMIIPNPAQGVDVLNFPNPQAVSGTVSVSNFPSSTLTTNAIAQFALQLQQLNNLQEIMIVELKVISNAIAQLNDGGEIDPDDIRSSIAFP